MLIKQKTRYWLNKYCKLGCVVKSCTKGGSCRWWYKGLLEEIRGEEMIKKIINIDSVKLIKNKLKSKKKCIWRGKYSYATGCGKEFFDASESGNPVTDWLSFCPYCGGKVEIE